MAGNPVVYWELASNDAEKSVKFFEELFGWKFKLDSKLNVFDVPADVKEFFGGGILTLQKAKTPFLTIYVKVDDIDEKAAKVEKLGGMIVEPPYDVSERIRVCLFNEPLGVTFAMIQYKNV